MKKILSVMAVCLFMVSAVAAVLPLEEDTQEVQPAPDTNDSDEELHENETVAEHDTVEELRNELREKEARIRALENRIAALQEQIDRLRQASQKVPDDRRENAEEHTIPEDARRLPVGEHPDEPANLDRPDTDRAEGDTSEESDNASETVEPAPAEEDQVADEENGSGEESREQSRAAEPERRGFFGFVSSLFG